MTKGANKRKFLVLKAQQNEAIRKELSDLVSSTDPKIIARVEKILKEYKMKSEDGSEAALDPKVEAALKAVVRILTPFKDLISDELLDSVLEESGVFKKTSEDPGQEGQNKTAESHEDDDLDDEMDDDNEDGPLSKKPDGVSKEHHEEAKKSASMAYKSHLEKMGYEKYDSPPAKNTNKSKNGEPDKGDEVAKLAITKEDGSLNLEAVPEEVRPAVELIYKSNQELIKKNAELAEGLKAERSDRRLKEFVAKAESLKNYTGDKQKLAKHMMDLSDANPELYKSFEENVMATEKQAEAVSKSLFAENGSAMSNPGGSSAEAKISASVDQIVQKSDGKVTKEQAYEKFMMSQEGQKLYAEFKSERKGGI